MEDDHIFTNYTVEMQGLDREGREGIIYGNFEEALKRYKHWQGHPKCGRVVLWLHERTAETQARKFKEPISTKIYVWDREADDVVTVVSGKITFQVPVGDYKTGAKIGWAFPNK